MIEEWRDVVGYEKYFKVSNFGNIYSKRSNKNLKLHKSKIGYLTFVTRLNGRNGGCKCLKVHILVATAFLSNLGNKRTVNHIDGNKSNAILSNLEWATYSENAIHANATGLALSYFCTSRNPSIKLTKEQYDFIVENYKPYCKSFGARALGRKLSLAHTTVLSVINKSRSLNFK